MKVLFLLVIAIFSFYVHCVETRGILEPIEGNSIVVGEAYPFKLTLLPFEKRLITKERLQGKPFLNIFHIANVEEIKTSENNYDAVEVFLDLVLVKKVEFREAYIWNLEDRNIPIEMPSLSVNDVSLNTKSFILLKTPNVDFKNKNYYMVGGILIGIALLLLALIMFIKSGKKSEDTSEELVNLLKNLKGHKDLEEVFKKRREILLLAHDPDVQQNIREVINSFEKVQYSPEWKNVEVTETIQKLKDYGEVLSRGV